MTQVTPVKAPKAKKSVLLWLGLFCIGAGTLFAGRMLYLKQEALDTRLNTISTNQNKSMAEWSLEFNTLKLELEKLNKEHETAPVDEAWALYKAQFAIQLAQMNAKWGNDSATTLALLKEADHLLSQLNDASLFPVRQALAHEIAMIESQPLIDTAGLLSQLDALQELIGTYTPTPPPLSNQAASLSKTTQNSWRDRLKATLLSFKQFFIIRHHENPLEPLMSPAFLTAQKEIIRLKLQEAEWALLQKNEPIYQMTLKQTREIVVRAFDPKNSIIINFLKNLDQLQSTSIETHAFIPTESLPLLQALLHHSSVPESGAAS